MPAVIIILIAGFPVAIVLAWLLAKPADPASQTGWQKRRWKLGAIVTPIVIAAVVVSGIFALRFSEQRAQQQAAAQAVAKTAVAPAPANTPSPPAVTAIPAQSIAVLPFVNLSGDPKQAYFGDGITEEILNALAQIPNLKVAGRTSAFQFTSKDEDVRKVGAILGVATVLEGSVQKAGDEVRITVQLIDAQSGYQVWSEKYDRKLANIFAIEDEISNAVADKLRVQWNNAQPLVAQKTMDPRAHDFYLRGLTLLAARGKGLRDAVTAFQNAVKIDPDYAQAWGALAQAEALLPDYALNTMQAAYPAALGYAERALALNPDLAAAYVAQGMVYKVQWQWSQADQAFGRALELAPGDAEAVDQYAQFLLTVGQFEPALTEIERAQQLDPLSAIIGTTRAYILLVLHRDDDAAAQIDSTLTAHPGFMIGRAFAILIYITLQRYPQAEEQARLLAHLAGGHPEAQMLLVRGSADPVLRAGALLSLQTSDAYARLRQNSLVYAGQLASLGANDRALDVLERFAIQHDNSHPELLWGPYLDPLRSNPRFKAVLKKMGLPYTPKDLPVATAN